jgi:archaellum component FlaC
MDESSEIECPVALDNILSMGLNYENLKIVLDYLLSLMKGVNGKVSEL